MIFAIGDIHGRFDLLTKALRAIETAAPDGATVVFLGDYIDRGPDSAKVVATLMAGPTRKGDAWICLRGNHEQMMVEAHSGGRDDRSRWLFNGGVEARASWSGSVPASVLAWCASRPIHYETASHYFVHAGIMPGVPLDQQANETRLWIRDRFMNDESDHGKHIVHGHTPHRFPELKPNRTNLDTGAVFYGTLVVARFEGPGGPAEIIEVHA